MLQQQECWFLYPGKEGQRVYIATQGCLQAVVHQENTRGIVTTSREVERGRLPLAFPRHLSHLGPSRRPSPFPPSSCSTWPPQSLHLGTPGKPSCASASSSPRPSPPGGRTQRLLRPEEPPHRARHFQYFGWPDYGVLGFRDEVNRAQSSERGTGPVAVPFSAGIGRTGTIIVIDILADVIRRQLEPPQERENQKVGTAPRESGCSPRPASPRAPAVTPQPWTRTCRATGV
ncbi:tyrosine-protein phosphatase non-receptor type 6-like [Macaca fascicularis]|uniref:tyrosine-protein phosphatase non-receptor type 6-like n=1 Tax=Macaca fascicularis TaxID=9541 RepID=UPI0032B087F3